MDSSRKGGYTLRKICSQIISLKIRPTLTTPDWECGKYFHVGVNPLEYVSISLTPCLCLVLESSPVDVIVKLGWLGEAKVSCSFCHRGAHLILAYSWAKHAVLAARNGRGGVLLFLLFLHFHSFSSFFPISFFHLLFYFFLSLSLGDDKKDPQCITKTCLYSFDPLKPHFYIMKLEFKGVYIIFFISAQKINCGFSLDPPHQGGSNEYPQSMFWAEVWKNIRIFYLKIFIFCGKIFSIIE